jgi:23S rRNA pseudouridine2604 synthase
MRLNKYIADTGFCSRREADRLVGEGRVTVNGIRAGIGAEVGEGDKVQVDGNPLVARTAAKGQRRHVYIALNKPVGITSTTESGVKDNIVDFVDHAQRIFPVGRLDKDSEGLILLTSNGDIVNRILRAENKLERNTWSRSAGRSPWNSCGRWRGAGCRSTARPRCPAGPASWAARASGSS